MSKYETPRIKVVEFEPTDIIQTSGLIAGGSTDIGDGTPVIPGIPTTVEDLNGEY